MVATKLVTLGAALALAVPAVASPATSYRVLRARDFQFPDVVPIEKRQDVSPDRFQCHSDCGNTILDGENDGYCDSSAWRSLLDACLECVPNHPIWQWYSEGVQGAAEKCGLSAEPGSPATPIGGGGDDEETTTAAAQPSTTAAPAPAPETTTEETAPTTEAGAPVESEVSEEPEEEYTTPAASATPSHVAPIPSHVPVPSNGVS